LEESRGVSQAAQQAIEQATQLSRSSADGDDGLAVADLPMHHRDPLDRLLIAQARFEQLRILSGDHRIADYDVPLIDAG